jgi:hypothetical protein
MKVLRQRHSWSGRLLTLVFFPLYAVTALAQCNGQALNTKPECEVGSNPGDGQLIYYDLNDCSNFDVLVQAQQSCDAGSYAGVTLYSPHPMDLQVSSNPVDALPLTALYPMLFVTRRPETATMRANIILP